LTKAIKFEFGQQGAPTKLNGWRKFQLFDNRVMVIELDVYGRSPFANPVTYYTDKIKTAVVCKLYLIIVTHSTKRNLIAFSIASQ